VYEGSRLLEYIEKYLAEKKSDLTAMLDTEKAYSNADFAVIAALTNYDSFPILSTPPYMY
jgi:ribosomal silencing factor RsfS